MHVIRMYSLCPLYACHSLFHHFRYASDRNTAVINQQSATCIEHERHCDEALVKLHTRYIDKTKVRKQIR